MGGPCTAMASAENFNPEEIKCLGDIMALQVLGMPMIEALNYLRLRGYSPRIKVVDGELVGNDRCADNLVYLEVKDYKIVRAWRR